nr:RNA-binding protein [Saprospiraceae bacterium]
MNIFVAKLSYDTSEDTLRSLFEQFGSVESAKIIWDREQNRSKGFGFVEMPISNEAVQAIEALDNYELDGRNIVVKKATPSGGGRPERKDFNGNNSFKSK